MARRLFALLAACFLLWTPARAAEPFALGFNQAWIEGKWAQDLTSGFKEEDWRRVLKRTYSSGASVLRVWLFEDKKLEGVVWDHHRPASVDPALLVNVRRLQAMAVEEKVRIYWTATDGNWFWPRSGMEWERVWNIANDKYAYGRAFRDNVLGPVLDVIKARPDANYAFDIVNEIEGMVKHWVWPDKWTGARRYMKDTCAFIKLRAPGLKVTSSAGHGEAAADILAGRFDGLGLHFYDLHIYTDQMTIPQGAQVVAHARSKGVKVVLGEFGQKKSAVDDAFQARHVRAILRESVRLGFAGALAWRLEDEQPDGRKFSFFDGAHERPAVAEVRAFARDYGL